MQASMVNGFLFKKLSRIYLLISIANQAKFNSNRAGLIFLYMKPLPFESPHFSCIINYLQLLSIARAKNDILFVCWDGAFSLVCCKKEKLCVRQEGYYRGLMGPLKARIFSYLDISFWQGGYIIKISKDRLHDIEICWFHFLAVT